MADLLKGTTPGPWHVERWTDENDQPIWDDDTNDYVFCVCHPDTVCDASTVVNISHEANARLIAKAPELAARVKVLEADNARLREERDFLLDRSSKAGSVSFGGERWTGMSSNALVAVAFGRKDNCLPYDGGDLAACYRTIIRLPAHLRTDAVMAQLAKGEKNVSEECVAWAREKTEWDAALTPNQEEG